VMEVLICEECLSHQFRSVFALTLHDKWWLYPYLICYLQLKIFDIIVNLLNCVLSKSPFYLCLMWRGFSVVFCRLFMMVSILFHEFVQSRLYFIILKKQQHLTIFLFAFKISTSVSCHFMKYCIIYFTI
jgi:hypothetical protein